MKIKVCMLAMAGIFAAPVFAEGIYAGLDMGRTYVKIDTIPTKHANNAQWFAGYQFRPDASIEMGMRYLGSIKDTSGVVNRDIDFRAFQASLLGIFPISPEFAMYGRVGVASIKYEIDPTIFTPKFSKTETKGVFGVGARYAVTKKFGLRAEFDQYAKFEKTKISTISASADYFF
ncbi:porin family protein [Chitinimonas sp. PSY-7]|uniref:outer membrane beta-barrel protein n=1 Tax=Chitinimonas sp. PSY-7 TaxID=3459088 RepID=UPI004040348A